MKKFERGFNVYGHFDSAPKVTTTTKKILLSFLNFEIQMNRNSKDSINYFYEKNVH